MRKQRFFIYTSQQSTLPPNFRTGKISQEIDMKAILKPKKKIAQEDPNCCTLCST